MSEKNVWIKAQSTQLQVSEDISPEISIGFDKQIPDDIRNELRKFTEWVESNYKIPVTLWVDFEFRHYLLTRDKKRVGFLFYWSDFSSYPVFNNKEDIPVIRLPVRTEYSSIEEILTSFIEAITYYFAWICNEIDDTYIPDECIVEEILEKYINYHNI